MDVHPPHLSVTSTLSHKISLNLDYQDLGGQLRIHLELWHPNGVFSGSLS